MSCQLAIVIPAYKEKYFNAALQSIANQTNKNFKVYIGDDGSPANLRNIAIDYSEQIDITYFRFPENIGHQSLTDHWNRSIKLSTECWVWLFADDDLMSPGCVEAFYQALEKTNARYDLYRFNIQMINAFGEVICTKEPHPQQESAYNFLQRRLLGKSLSAAVEYIFRRKVFDENEGFLDFPLAYCADDASWINFAADGELYTLDRELVYWRSSGVNISSAFGLQDEKSQAMLQFLTFCLNKFPEKRLEIIQVAEPWFYENLTYLNGKLSAWQLLRLWRSLSDLFPTKSIRILKKLMAAQLANTRFAGKLK